MPTPAYDVVVAGAGPAGFALLHALDRRLPRLRTLLIDRVARRGNDRTWCFWETHPGPFEALVAHTWTALDVHAPDATQPARRLRIAPYAYKMIRGDTFFDAAETWLAQRPWIERRQATLRGWREDGGEVEALLDDGSVRARWAFDGALVDLTPHPDHHLLLQHFLGFEIRTDRDHFDPTAATFMDFRVPQRDGTCFVYVLPTTPRTAMVEYTVFSADLWPRERYERELGDYLTNVLRIDAYEIDRSEYGVIPMTDRPFPARRGKRILTIGTAGGRTKASTGFTFTRLLRHADQLAEALLRARITGAPLTPPRGTLRHGWMDGVLLRALATGRQDGSVFFTRLLHRNPPERVLRFLDEDTTLAEEVRLMASVDVPLFWRIGTEVLLRRIRSLTRR
jgi:lycopene beta-cyclase